MKPPINGAVRGPMKTIKQNVTTGTPRCSGVNMSANAGPAIVRGPDPKKPAKKRKINKAYMLSEIPVANDDSVKPNIDQASGKYLPFRSDKGPKISGPNAKPKTYKDTPSVATSFWMSYARITAGIAGAKMLLAEATIIVLVLSIVQVAALLI